MTDDERHAELMGALRHVFAKLAGIEKRLDAAERRDPAPRGESSEPAGGGTASAADLDGPRGNPTIKFDPREKYWQGPSFVGYRFSETTPEYLDAVAKSLDAGAYMAAKDPDEKKRGAARYKTLDAARARGWAARLRAQPAGATSANGQSNGAAKREPGDDLLM